jgi:hypothetical protein
MAKLRIDPAPTFNADVDVPVAGGASVPVQMTFRHRTRDELDEFIKGRANKTDDQSFMDMVVGWDFEDEFSEENVRRLLQKRIGVALATFHKYIDELTKAREKN